jgi:WXG100 family type VII secretion target
MAGDRVQADLAVLSSVSSGMANDFTQLQAALARAEADADMYTANWKGSAKTAYDGARANLVNAWNELCGVLDEITSGINRSGTGYSDADTQNASGYKNVNTTDISHALKH